MNTEVWRVLTEGADERTEMLKVPGGWLFRTRTFDWLPNHNGDLAPRDSGVALAFQPERP